MIYDKNGSVSIEAIMQSGNLYGYCMGNPVLYRDANGKWIHLAVGAVVGGVIGGITSGFTQYMLTGEIDWGKVAIATGAGAVSGVLASTGVGLVGQIAGNAVIAGVSNVGEQLYVNKGDITKTNIEDVMISAFIGSAGGYMGGSGGGGKYLDSLTAQLFKRTSQAVQYGTTQQMRKEITQAVSYYVKSVGKSDLKIARDILKSYVPSLVQGGVSWIDEMFDTVVMRGEK